MPVRDHARNLARVGDVVQWIRLEQDEIGDPAYLDRAVVAPPVEEICGIKSGGLQGLERSEAGCNEALQFEMEADARNDIHSRGVSVPARNGTCAACSLRTMSSSCSTNRSRTGSGSVSSDFRIEARDWP